jgi:serine/threonine-protein kinase RsbW
VRESVANAVKHGNKFDESKKVELTLECSDESLAITVRDFGTGFSVKDVPDPTDPENLLKVNGPRHSLYAFVHGRGRVG